MLVHEVAADRAMTIPRLFYDGIPTELVARRTLVGLG
jgi:hypothetical protein